MEDRTSCALVSPIASQTIPSSCSWTAIADPRVLHLLLFVPSNLSLSLQRMEFWSPDNHMFIFFSFSFSFSFFFNLATAVNGAPRLGIRSEPHSRSKLQLEQQQILNPLCWAGGPTRVPALPRCFQSRGITAGVPMVVFNRYCQVVFQSGYANLYSHCV